MKVLIVGGGAVGSVIARFLDSEKSVKEIICGDKNPASAKKFLNLKSKKLSLVKLDATSEKQMLSASKDVDLIINASLPHFNPHIMNVAIKAGKNYQDLCSHLDKSHTPVQLQFDKQFKKENIVGLINTGMAPGITNVLAKTISDKFDSVDSIKIRTLIDPNSIEPIFAMSPEITLEESTSPALVYRNRKYKLVKQFKEAEYYEFPEPIGKRFVFSVYGDEVATLPMHIKTKNVDFKSGGVDIEASKLFFDMGLLSSKPIKIGKESFVPLDLFSEKLPKVPSPKEMMDLLEKGIVQDALVVLVVEADGTRFGKKVSIKSSIVFPTLKEMAKVLPGATYISYPTGLAAFCFSKIISKIKEKGVFLPESLDSGLIQNILLELADKNIAINEKISKLG